VISGRVLRVRQLRTARGRPLLLRVLRPDASRASKDALLEAEKRWTAQAKAATASSRASRERALFAADVAYIAAHTLREAAKREATHHVLVAVDQWGDLLGAVVFHFAGRAWHLDLQAVRPQDQPGWPNPDQVRGIGSEMLGEAVAQMNRQVCARVELEPLDKAAERFWKRRGFHNTQHPLRMSCPESRALAAALAHTELDDPALGDAPYAADPALLRAVGSRY